MNKTELRAAMRTLLRGVETEAMARRSAKIAEAIAMTEAWARSDVLLAFLSMPHEIDTAAMIAAARAAGKTVAVPRIEGEDIRFLLMPSDVNECAPSGHPAMHDSGDLRDPSGRRGALPRDAWHIPVPDPSWSPLDLGRFSRPLVAAPGLAFDRLGNRLGRGKGFYDRFLAAARGAAPALVALGVCLDEQVVEAVPHSPSDQPLDGIVTDRETVMVLRP